MTAATRPVSLLINARCLYCPRHDHFPSFARGAFTVNGEFHWWLIIVGLVLGAALTWLVMSESMRREIDITRSEQRSEARWIETVLAASGRAIPEDRVEEILRLHHDYLAAPPPDEPIEPDEAPPIEDRPD